MFPSHYLLIPGDDHHVLVSLQNIQALGLRATSSKLAAMNFNHRKQASCKPSNTTHRGERSLHKLDFYRQCEMADHYTILGNTIQEIGFDFPPFHK
jgi:hypothetical protein